MTTGKRIHLEALPQVAIPSPVSALAVDPAGGLWAGGVGGVAYFNGLDWSPYISGLPLTGVTALLYAGGWLLAGGVEGLARSQDGGLRWQPAHIAGQTGVITAIAASPGFEQDKTLLAGSLGAGVYRSEDAGATWTAATFGLQSFDVLALAWRADTVLVGTSEGIYRSSNGGRAWKLIYDGEAVAALAFLPDGGALAALETGRLLVSSDGGIHWKARSSNLPKGAQITALAGEFLATSDSGVYRSEDSGKTWTLAHEGAALALATVAPSHCFAGKAGGVAHSRDNGDTWTSLPTPPVHDLRRIITASGRILLAGRYTIMLAYEAADKTWKPLAGAPLPLTLIREHEGTLFASGADGLFCSLDGGETWLTLLNGAAGHINQLTLQSDGLGWASSADGERLLRTLDGGHSWAASASPFGVLPVVMLQAAPGVVFAATFDARRQVVTLWRSTDGGVRWLSGVEIASQWPLVTSFPDPALIALPGMLLVCPDDPNEPWQRAQFDRPGVTVRAIAGSRETLFALTLNDGIFLSSDGGKNWAHLPLGLPGDQLLDVASDAGRLLVLASGGRAFRV